MLQGLSVRAGTGVSLGQRVAKLVWAALAQLGWLAPWPATASTFGAVRTRAPVWLRRLLTGLLCVLVFGGSGLAHAAPPTVTSISPASGSTAGGTPVTITGSNFSGPTAVIFGGASATSATIISATEITATTPSGTGTVDVVITTPSGTATLLSGYTYTALSPPVAGAVSATVAYGSSANPITLNLSGGTATSVAVASAAAHGTATASGTRISYTPTAGYGGPDSFTYTATNAAGTSSPATITITVTVSAPTNPTIAPPTMPAATVGTAYSQTLTASGGTAPYSYSITFGSVPNGTTLAANGLLSGTPTTAGSYSFTVTATDSSTGIGGPFTGSRSYSGTVAAAAGSPVAGGVSVSVAYGSINYPITLNLSGGAATSVALASAPAHGMATASGTSITYTPSAGYSGADSFTYTATNAAGTSSPATITLTVGVAPVVAVNDNASTPANQAITIPVTANDTGAITSITIGTPPAHGSASVSGLGVVYTPANNYAGSDTLSYTVTGPGGTSAPATVTITVTALSVPVAVPQTVTVLAGQPVTLHAANGASGGPFTAVVITSPPSAGTAVVIGTDILYTPAAGSSGDIRFSYTLANAFGASAPVTATVTVNPLPMAGAHSATAKAGTAVNIDLMAGATGGPFNAASIVALTPAAAGTALIRDVGTPGSPSFQMSFTPASAFAGAAVVSYTLRNAQATSAPGQVSITVAPRPDMASNAEVTGLLTAQTDSAKRFASAQMSNFSRRLESLHGDGWGRSDFGISLAASTGRTASDEAQRQSGEADRYVGATLQPNLRKVGWSQRRGDYAAAQDQGGDTAMAAADHAAGGNRLPNLPEPREQANKQAFSLWVGGALDYGRQDAKGQQADYKFTTSGLSVGGDYRISDRATIGLGAGISRGSSTIGSDGSKSSAGSTVAVVYGSLRPAKDVFVDGMLGYGKLDFDTTRYITDGGGFATGTRQGEQVFGSLASGVEYRGASWLWSPYGRLEMSSTTLDAYTETAPSLKALTYFKQTVRTTNGILGLRAEERYATAWGMLMPRVRLEYTHRFEGADEARLAYADLGPGGPVYIVRSNGQDFGNWTTGLGAKLVLRNGVALSLDFNTNINMSSGRSQSLMVGVAAPF